MFVEFRQNDDVVHRRSGGTGLGLAISRRLARAMGGDIEVTSERGAGSTFCVSLSLEAVAASQPALPVPQERLEPRTILLISDRFVERRLLAETLVAAGFGVVETGTDGAEVAAARALARGVPFHAIIADASIGADRARALVATASQPGAPPVRGIVLIDVPGRTGLAPFHSTGFDSYLVRPVRPASLLTQLDASPAAKLTGSAGDGENAFEAAPALAGARGRRVLLVEDNDINALLAERMIEKAGLEVFLARNGGDAGRHCQLVLEDLEPGLGLVLMDIHMPGIGGFEAARTIRDLYAAAGRQAPPIVALTADAFAQDRERCLEGGFDDYLAKPFEKEELEALLAKWCDRPHAGCLGGFAA
jgi:CheY-like chemotaxis protein